MLQYLSMKFIQYLQLESNVWCRTYPWITMAYAKRTLRSYVNLAINLQWKMRINCDIVLIMNIWRGFVLITVTAFEYFHTKFICERMPRKWESLAFRSHSSRCAGFNFIYNVSLLHLQYRTNIQWSGLIALLSWITADNTEITFHLNGIYKIVKWKI